MPRKQIVVVSLVVAAALVAGIVFVVRSAGVRVTASSGGDPSALLDADGGSPAWTSDGETVGAWVELEYDEPTEVDRVRLSGARGVDGALLTFDGGSALMVTADDGAVTVDFPSRTVSRVRLTVAAARDDASSVALDGLSLDDDGDAPAGDGGEVRAATSSGGSEGALTDGAPADGETGDTWAAAADDDQPWAELSWERPREVASVQVFGPPEASDASGAALHGRLRFDDGSSVVVSGIAGGEGEATTIAVAPRMATSVRLELERTDPSATVGLRELAVHDTGTTPPRWPREDGGTSASPPAAGSCEAAADPVADPVAGELTLVCPTPGATVDGSATVVVAADPGTQLEALAWTGASGAAAGATYVMAEATADDDGRATFELDTSTAPHGPLTLAVRVAGDDAGTPLYVQLLNLSGTSTEQAGQAPQGMTLQWAEEFTGPFPVSNTGVGADYSAIKPDAASNGQFGDATFVDPAADPDMLATVAEDYLRIRTRPGDPGRDTSGTGNVAAIAASADVGGAGFAAQYGYFEARLLGAPGRGTWPAFWMMNSESAARDTGEAGEVDAVELYGHNTGSSCHTVHSWGDDSAVKPESTAPHCIEANGFADWALAWHTYGARVTPDGTTFTIDGLVVSTVRGLWHDDEPYFFLLDLALGGGWPVDLSPTGGVSDMYVDWVRVYT